MKGNIIFSLVAVLCLLAYSGTASAATKTKSVAKLSCRSTISIGSLGNVLYKNANVHGGRGRSFLDQGHRFGGAGTLRVAGTNGTIIGCFGLYRCDAPYGCRYYQAMCGDHSGNGAFAGAARQNGNGNAVVGTGNGVCYSFPASASRFGSVHK